jgi:hypothetical protein
MVATLTAGAATRGLWSLWNRAAMDDLTASVYRLREPLVLYLCLWLEFGIVAAAVLSWGALAFFVSAAPMIVVLAVTTWSMNRVPVPSALSRQAPDDESSAVSAARALWRLLVPLIQVIGVVGIIASVLPISELLTRRSVLLAAVTVVLVVAGVALATSRRRRARATRNEAVAEPSELEADIAQTPPVDREVTSA